MKRSLLRRGFAQERVRKYGICFRGKEFLIGRLGNHYDAKTVVQETSQVIQNGDVEIEKNQKQGYVIESASVRFVVGWKDTTDGQEYPIILPDVYFVRKR